MSHPVSKNAARCPMSGLHRPVFETSPSTDTPLGCLVEIIKLIVDGVTEPDKLLPSVAKRLNFTWREPGEVITRVVLNGTEFSDSHGTDSQWQQKSPIAISGQVCGFVEAMYANDLRDAESAPLADEERRLLDATAEILGRVLERTESAEVKRAGLSRFRALTDAATDAIIMIDDQGKVVNWNRSAEGIFGYRESEIKGRNLHDILAPEPYLQKCQSRFTEFSRSGDGPAIGATVEVEALRKGGEPFPVELSLSSLKIDGRWHALGVVRDISERKAAERELRRTHEDLQQIFDGAPPMALIDLDQTILKVNSEYATLLESTPEKMVGKRCCDAIPGSTCGTPSCCLVGPRSGQTVITESVKYIGQDRHLPCVIRSTPFRGTNGEVVGAIVSVTDISEMKRSERALRSSELRFRALFESSSDAIMTLSPPAWRFNSANPATIEMFGVESEEEFTLYGLWDLAPGVQPDGTLSAKKATEMISRAIRDGSHSFKWTQQKVDGTLVPAMVQLTRMNLDGRLSLQATIRDMTEIERYAEEQARNNDRLQSLLQLSTMRDMPIDEITSIAIEECKRLTNSQIGYLATLDETESQLVLQYWSDQKEVCKVDASQAITWPLDTESPWSEAIRQCGPVTENCVGENDFGAWNPPRGVLKLLRHVAVPLFDGDRLVAIAGVANKPNDYDGHDVRQVLLFMDGWLRLTQAKQAEQTLIEARQAAEAANRAKSQFLANMSHEIRTPMTAILGFTDLLLSELHSPEATDFARTIKRNGEHLLRLINDILDLSKVEASKMEIERIPWSPRQVVAEVVSLMHVPASAKGLLLREECADKVPETVTTDPVRLRQILVNLVGNAIKFTESGEIRIGLRIDCNEAGENRLLFDVSDTGLGIPSDNIDSVFHPFTQVDGSASRRHEGTGLGLAISRLLAEALGGELRVESQLAKGSTFTLDLPLLALDLDEAEAAHEPAELDAPVSPQGDSGDPFRPAYRVLLAEDIPDNQRLIAAILRGAGMAVTVAGNGYEALEQALPECSGRPSDGGANELFDVILMDIQMPGLDGLEATRSLRLAGYSGPIVALTAHAMPSDRKNCIHAGCDDYLTKPVDHHRLLDVVNRWAARKYERFLLATADN